MGGRRGGCGAKIIAPFTFNEDVCDSCMSVGSGPIMHCGRWHHHGDSPASHTEQPEGFTGVYLDTELHTEQQGHKKSTLPFPKQPKLP